MAEKGDKPEKKDELSEAEKLKLAGIDADKLVDEIATGIEGRLTEKLMTAIGNIKTGLGEQVDKLGGELDSLMQSKIDVAVKGFDIPAIVQQVAAQLPEKTVTTGDNSAGGASLSLRSIAQPEVIDGVVKLITAYRQPSGDEQLMSIFRTFIQGMNFGQKLKEGRLSPDDMEKALGVATGKQTG